MPRYKRITAPNARLAALRLHLESLTGLVRTILNSPVTERISKGNRTHVDNLLDLLDEDISDLERRLARAAARLAPLPPKDD